MHITLKFIGEHPDDTVEAIQGNPSPIFRRHRLRSTFVAMDSFQLQSQRESFGLG